MKNEFQYWLLYVNIWCFCTNPSDRILTIRFGLYQTGFYDPGMSPLLLVYVTPALQWKIYIFSTKIISDVWHIFSVDESVACWLIVEEAPIFINTSFYCRIQDGISHTHYASIVFALREHFLGFICVRIHLQYFIWWGLTEHKFKIWDIISFFGGVAHHDNAWYILKNHRFFFFPSSIRRHVAVFYLFRLPETFCIIIGIFSSGEFTVFRIVEF